MTAFLLGSLITSMALSHNLYTPLIHWHCTSWQTSKKVAIMLHSAAGLTLAPRCCQAHARISSIIGNSTPCTTVTPEKYIAPTSGAAPTKPVCTEIFTVVAIPDVILCAKFWRTEILRGYGFTGGRIFHLPMSSLQCFLLLTWDNYSCS